MWSTRTTKPTRRPRFRPPARWGPRARAGPIPTSQSVAIPEEILLISPASTSDEITGLDDNGLVNRTAPPDSFQGPTLANYVADELGGAEGKTVNIGARN